VLLYPFGSDMGRIGGLTRDMQLVTSIKKNLNLRAAAMRKQVVKVGNTVGEALRTMEESEVIRAVRLSLHTQLSFYLIPS
jgi:hypothetical protein